MQGGRSIRKLARVPFDKSHQLPTGTLVIGLAEAKDCSCRLDGAHACASFSAARSGVAESRPGSVRRIAGTGAGTRTRRIEFVGGLDGR